jgi:hypothetical protein
LPCSTSVRTCQICSKKSRSSLCFSIGFLVLPASHPIRKTSKMNSCPNRHCVSYWKSISLRLQPPESTSLAHTGSWFPSHLMCTGQVGDAYRILIGKPEGMGTLRSFRRRL